MFGKFLKKNFQTCSKYLLNRFLSTIRVKLTLIHKLKTANVALNRKVLADLAMNHPETFAAIVKTVA